MSEMVIIIWYACLCVAWKIEGAAAASQGSVMSEGSPGTTDDLTGRRECMQKPHVQQPAVNSKYVVSLAGHCIFSPVHTQFASNKDWASSRALFSFTLPSQREETPFSLFVRACFGSAFGHFLKIRYWRRLQGVGEGGGCFLLLQLFN